MTMNIDPYISDGQDPAVVEKLILKLLDMLASEGEEIAYIAVQKKPAITLFPNSIALTNKRVFICKSMKLGLVTDFEIIYWKEVSDLSFKEGLLGAQVTIKQQNTTEIAIDYIPKNQARKLYKVSIEARLAINAENNEGQSVEAIEMPSDESEDELTIKLKKLKLLFDRNLITESEYEHKKMELLSQL